MAAGDYLIRGNTSNVDPVPNTQTGNDLLLLWDTAIDSKGSSISYSSGTFTLSELGHYLVICSDQCKANDSANDRISYKTTINVGGIERIEGYSTQYIRKISGCQDAITFSAGIIEIDSLSGGDNELQMRTRRIDSTGVEPTRRSANSGITIMKLDDDWNYARYQSSSVFLPPTTNDTSVTANVQTTLEENSPFTRTGDTINIATDNFVLAIYSLKSEDPFPGARSEYQGRLMLNGAAVFGSYSHTYIRTADNCNWGGMSNMCILNPSDGDTLNLELITRDGGGGEDFEATLQLIELPSSASVCILEATDGVVNIGTPPATVNFEWDTNPIIDSSTYTHVPGSSNIDLDVSGDYLVMATQARTSRGGGTRTNPMMGFKVNSSDITYGGHSTYGRAGGNSGHWTLSSGTLLPNLSSNDSIYTTNARLGSQSFPDTNQRGAMTLLRTDNLFPSGAPIVMSVDSGSILLDSSEAILENSINFLTNEPSILLGSTDTNLKLDISFSIDTAALELSALDTILRTELRIEADPDPLEIDSSVANLILDFLDIPQEPGHGGGAVTMRITHGDDDEEVKYAKTRLKFKVKIKGVTKTHHINIDNEEHPKLIAELKKINGKKVTVSPILSDINSSWKK